MDGVSALARRIAALPRPLLLAFDVDGTLAPIVDDPAAARVPAPSRRLLRALVDARGLRVALITGRDAGSLAGVIRLPGAWRGLEHGRRVVAPGESARPAKLTAEERRKLRELDAWAAEHATPVGARLERKPAARAIHVRELAASDAPQAEAILREARRAAKRVGLSVRDGRAVVEAELHPGDKADALDRIASKTRAKGVFYAGDDKTDVPAIRRAEALGGIGVFVRSPERNEPRGIDGAVDGPDGILALLEHLVEAT